MDKRQPDGELKRQNVTLAAGYAVVSAPGARVLWRFTGAFAASSTPAGTVGSRNYS